MYQRTNLENNILRSRPHGAEKGENDPVLFYAVQKCLCKDGVMVKPHRAVETLQQIFKALVLPEESETHQAGVHTACALCTFSHEKIQPFKLS